MAIESTSTESNSEAVQPVLRGFKLKLAYDGANYAGWQAQLGQKTLQETLETALTSVTGEKIRVVGSGRTDSGVHALGQVVSFVCHSQLPPRVLQKALNAELPADVSVLAAEYAPLDFHAIRAATRKRYRYVLHDGPLPDVFGRNYAWHIYRRLDHEAMHRAAQVLVGRHDFASFQSSGSTRKSSVRNVFEVSVMRTECAWSGRADRVVLEIEADGFLYNMVRAIVGSLVKVGRGVRPEPWLGEVLAACDRQRAAITAPPQGLFLLEVKYD